MVFKTLVVALLLALIAAVVWNGSRYGPPVAEVAVGPTAVSTPNRSFQSSPTDAEALAQDFQRELDQIRRDNNRAIDAMYAEIERCRDPIIAVGNFC